MLYFSMVQWKSETSQSKFIIFLKLTTQLLSFLHWRYGHRRMQRRKFQFPFSSPFNLTLYYQHNFSFLFFLSLCRLSPSQRKCRLTQENEELLNSAVYSFNLCRTECRFRMALKECQCVPFFYRNPGI